AGLQNVDSLEDFLHEQLEIAISLKDFLQNGALTFNPIFINRTTRNPFNLNERLYPVDLGSQRHITHNVSILLPPGIKVQTCPKNLSMKLPEEGAKFIPMFGRRGALRLTADAIVKQSRLFSRRVLPPQGVFL